MQELLPGTEVAARGLRWEVVFGQPAGEQQLDRLRCLEGGLRGQELDVLVPFETITPIATEIDPKRAARLQDWRVLHQAFLLEQALGPDALLAAQPGRLRIAAYQLVPVMRALRMPRPRLLIADDVGLGKTIEAGLVLAELIARRRSHRILIVSPAGPLLLQWHREMRERFGLNFRVLDSDTLKQIRFQTEFGANPFDGEALGLISMDFAKQEKVLQDLERSHFDVVIIDEAHHCVSLGSSGDREDSQRRRLAEVLARKTDALLLLTATPHDGYEEHFASLVELLDPSLVDGRGAIRGNRYMHHVIRRLKRHIKDPDTGAPMFRERKVLPISVPLDPVATSTFVEYQQALLTLVAPRLRSAIRSRAYGEVLAFVSLLKRSASTAAACSNTLQVVVARLGDLAKKGEEGQEARKERLRTLRDLQRRRDRFGVLSFEEEQEQTLLEAEDMAAGLAETGAEELQLKLIGAKKDSRREHDRVKRLTDTCDALNKLIELATRAAQEDPKLQVVLDQIRLIRALEPRANILVYSEYADSQQALLDFLGDASKVGDLTGELLAISGADPDAVREKATTAFTTRDNLVLVSTDASSEGLNLHERCHHLIHLELPYNPNRLEQRNGRIDRFGQTKDPEIRYLYLTCTFEERLLMRLVAKYEAQRKRFGFVPNALGVTTTDAGSIRLLEGLADEEGPFKATSKTSFVLEGAEPDDTGSPAYKDMLAEVDRVLADFERASRTHSWLGAAGLNAEEGQILDADAARERGGRMGVVDLLEFVVEALRTDSSEPNAARERTDGIWELRLPPTWLHGLAQVPGYDAEARLLRLTTRLEQFKDAEDRAVGFIGRAHPVVRRALDRVRNIQLGSTGQILDRRVAAASTDRGKPEILYTYLGRLQSGAGRELERVLAVRVTKGESPNLLAAYEGWASLASSSLAIPTAGVWEAHFRDWASVSNVAAHATATQAFKLLVDDYVKEHAPNIATERMALGEWFRAREREICGARDAQVGLFQDKAITAAPAWRSLPDGERLAAFALDAANSPKARSEAQTVISLERRRDTELAQREKLEPPTISPLGMLLLVPSVATGKTKAARRGA